MQTTFRTISNQQNLQVTNAPTAGAQQVEVTPQKIESDESQRVSSPIFQRIYENSAKTTEIFKSVYQNKQVVVKYDLTPLGKAELTAMKWLQEKSSGTEFFGPTELDELAGYLPATLSTFPSVPLICGETLAGGLNPTTYIISPYYREGDLIDLVNRVGPLTLNSIRPIAYQLLYYLATLENHNKIHCDIKPDNILLDSGVIRVGDPAMMLDLSLQGQIGTHSVFGSRPFMAPEIVLNTKDFKKVDVWSAGMTLLAAATGSFLLSSDETMDPTQFQKQLLFQCIQILGPIPETLLQKVNVAKIGIEGGENQSSFGPLLKRDGSYAGAIPQQLPLAPVSINGLLENVYGPDANNSPWSPELHSFSNLLNHMLDWDPNRLRAREALHHPFFEPLFETIAFKPLFETIAFKPL